MKKAMILIVALFPIMSSNAFAASQEFTACTEELSEPAKLILQAVGPKLAPGSDARSIMRSTVMDLVKSGEIKRSEARSSAEAVGACLLMLKE